MSTDDVLQPPSGPALDEYGVPVEPRTGNRLVTYGLLAGFTVLPIATAFATVRYEPPHQSKPGTPRHLAHGLVADRASHSRQRMASPRGTRRCAHLSGLVYRAIPA